MSLAQTARLLRAVAHAPQRSADARIEAANRWTVEARPIIHAMFALEDVDGSLTDAKAAARRDRKWSEPQTRTERIYAEAKRYVAVTYEQLHEVLDGIRDNYVTDEQTNYPASDQDAADAVNDQLENETISVKRAIEIAMAEQEARR